MDPASVAALAVGSALGAMYADARFQFRYDLYMIKSLALAAYKCYKRSKQGRQHYYYNFRDMAKAYPNRIFLLFEDKSYTYLELERASSRLAHWLLNQGIKSKDVVCMMEQNHPTFFTVLFAISKIGAIPALINTNLKSDALFHCVSVVKPRMLLFDPKYSDVVATVVDRLEQLGIRIFAYDEDTETQESACPIAPSLTPSVLSGFSDMDTSESLLTCDSNNACMLIYTSGTTGMPKAAIAHHERINFISTMSAILSEIKSTDRTYCVLPLYHSAGLWVSFGAALYANSTFVLARKFSASHFWEDCVKYDITRINYIGELCHYLLNQPYHPLEAKHKVNLMFGNGLRPEVWTKFRERFGIGKIWEFYGATEGTTGFFNFNENDSGAGAIGRMGALLRLAARFVIIKIDTVTEEPLRDKRGLCIQESCKPDEYGEAVTLIQQSGVEIFNGYYDNNEATHKKIIRNVKKKGDIYFRTGDLLKVSPDGFIYFGDRLGDTFRWHAENVATTEVKQVATDYPGIAEASSYGVHIPYHEGQAGMIAIVCQPNATVDLEDYYRHLAKHLPRYAIPLFIRFTREIEVTGTFKQQKARLRSQGIDLSKLPPDEPIFWARNNTYVPFTKEDYAELCKGSVRL